MGVAHLHAALLELVPDGAVVDIEVLADTGEGLPIAVELLSFVDLASGETSQANLNARAL